MRTTCITLGLTLVALAVVKAEEPGQFQFKKGQVLEYRVEHSTRAADISQENKSELASRIEQTKRWEVLDVDTAGVATLQLSLIQLKMRQQPPSGEVLEFDSEKPDQSSEQLRKAIAPLLGKPLAVLRLDSTGKVIEVKSSMGPASRYESELPFAVTVPGKPLEVGQRWNRDYQVALEPPLGTGEKFPAQQSYEVKSLAKGQATITFSTTLKEPPANASDRIPLLQFQPRGEVVFWSAAGLLWKAQLISSGVLEGHAGPGSRYEFSSEYREQLVKYQ
jgi:hypothetical protein